MLSAGEGNKASHVESEMSVADLEKSQEKEMRGEKPVSRQSLIVGDQSNEESMLRSQPDHCHKKLVSIQNTGYIH